MEEVRRMRILIGYDGSGSADAALDDLRRAGLPRGGEVLVVSVEDMFAAPIPSAYEASAAALTSRRVMSAVARAQAHASESLAEARRSAAKASRRVRSYLPGWEVRAEVLAGTPSLELLQKAGQWKPDLLVVGSHGRSAHGRLLLGSVSKKVAAEAASSVRVARRGPERGASTPPRIVVGVDGSSGAERAIRSVGSRVWPVGTAVRLVAVDDGTSPTRIAHVLPATAAAIRGGNEEVAAAARVMVEWAEEELRAVGLNASVVNREGDPQRVLLEEARKWAADCIFVGSRGFRSAFERLRLGSVSTALVTNAGCSVEVVRPHVGE